MLINMKPSTIISTRSNGYHFMTGALRKYLDQEVDPDDFIRQIGDYFQEKGIEPPASFDPEDPIGFLEYTDYDRVKKDFSKWLVAGAMYKFLFGDDDDPSYATLKNPSLLPPRTWLVHFSDNAERIAAQGFLYGHNSFNGLALTTHKSHGSRHRSPGFNFAFTADDRHLDYVANRGKYGHSAVLFRSGGVRAFHYGDDEWQVIFWGPVVKQVVLIERCAGGSWCILDQYTSRELCVKGSVVEAVRWAIDHGHQYRRKIVRDLPTVNDPA